ncbi:MAG: leucyl aminopeptidase [Acidobacteriota bacterium]|nr:leucyl aminopeptidase [Acidobacteriota bacterium]
MPLTHTGSPNKLNVRLAAEVAPPQPRDITALCVFGSHAHDAELCGATGATLAAVRGLIHDGDFKGEEGETLVVHAPIDEGARRLLLVGTGAREDERDEARALRRAAATAVRRATEAKAHRLFFILPTPGDRARNARAVAEGALLGSYANDFYQSRDDEDEATLAEFVVISDESDERARMTEEIERGRIIGESVNWARSLADEPGASLPPREFARRAAQMAAEFRLKVETLDAAEIRARGMGGLWGVGQGSDEPPALIVVRYEPEGAGVDDELFAFVGKGITFDTGGISIKPALGMEEMKSDMAGGAAALGALRAIAQLKPRCRVVAVVPTAENMPSEKSIKPGDVVRTFAGYTVEVVDTDAEGRLILIDGIAYARSLGATRIVDLATLTGSIIVALGDHRAGLFSNDDEWARRVALAAERAGEPVWRMPVSDDYKKRIESDIADFKNYGGRPDATGAALLLSKFAAETPWVHLDIAATAWLEEPNAHAPAGATGAGVRTLVELVCG